MRMQGKRLEGGIWYMYVRKHTKEEYNIEYCIKILFKVL